jgi:F420-dependent oxidoreductase-like protein
MTAMTMDHLTRGRVLLGTAVSQLSARPPVTLAMTAMTMDHLTRGRVLLGIGTSNPQVVEGWYGQPYPRPLVRTREYIDIVRKVIARQEPVRYDGRHYQIPLQAGTGLGKPLRSILYPYRTEIPIYLGAEGPRNVALAAEIADGWNAIFFSPAMNDFYAAALAEGFARPGARHSRDTFDRLRPAPARKDHRPDPLRAQMVVRLTSLSSSMPRPGTS